MLLPCLHFCFPVQAGAQQRCWCAQLAPWPVRAEGSAHHRSLLCLHRNGNDVGDVTDMARLMFLVILPGGRITSLEQYFDFVFCS